MLRSLRLALGVAAFAAALPQVASAAEPLPLGKRGPLRVLAYPEKDRPEFFSVDPKQSPGFEREILDGFARAQKLQIEIVVVPKWEALMPSLEEGKGDIVASHFTETEERRAHVDFTHALLPTRSVVVTRRPSPMITTLKQLQATEKIGAVRSAATFEDLIAAGVPGRTSTTPSHRTT